MAKNKHKQIEQQMNNVLKYQSNELSKLKANSDKERNKREFEIEELERKLIDLGVDPKSVAKNEFDNIPKKVMIVPSWENLYKEAEKIVGNSCDIDSILTEDEIQNNEDAICKLRDEYNQIHKLDKIDIAISAIAGIIGSAVDLLMVGIPKRGPDGLKAGTLSNYIRKKFEETFPEEEMQKLANLQESKVPFDAQDNRNTVEFVTGLSAYYHRLLSLGHDPLLGFAVGVFDILTGRMTTIDKNGNIISQVMKNYEHRKEKDIFEALAKQFTHLKSDVTTSMGLPAPLMDVFNLFQFGSIGEENQTIAEIVQGMYYEGYDFIHFCSLSIPVMIIEVIVRVSYACKCLKERKSLSQSIPFSLNRNKHPKLSTMLFIAHSGASAINVGKIYFTKNPLAINYPQWIAFAKYSYKQLLWTLIEKPDARIEYVNDKLENRWNEIATKVDSSFNEFTKDYTVVFE